MKFYPLILFVIFCSSSFVAAEPSHPTENLLTYSNRPLGSPQQPLLLRTFMPEPGLKSAVLSHHHRAANSPRYRPKLGIDVPGEYKPIDGLPAAIGVNYGSALSYCWDTVECRLLYAWNKGFLDMKAYWGNPSTGNRQSYNYVPHLVGSMFYKAAGKDPLQIAGKSVSDLSEAPRFIGYQVEGKRVVFEYVAGGVKLFYEVSEGEQKQSLSVRYRLEGEGELGYQANLDGHKVEKISRNELLVTIQGSTIADFNGYPDENLVKGGVTLANGERVFNAMACGTCHSLDGSKSHGPSLMGIHGQKRMIKGSKEPILVNDSYILESIKNPNAKIVAGYPENYMPPYQLSDDEYQALLIFIKSYSNQANE